MDVTYDYDGRSYTGYLATPEPAGAVPGILVIHGGGGLGEQAKKRAEMLAELGYVAFAPDLFGETVVGVEAATVVTGRFTDDWAELRARCAAGLDVLTQQTNVDENKLAVIGFCFGGQAALEFARSGAGLRAVVGFHSQLKTHRPEDSVNIRGKVLICLGDRDCFVSREDRETFMENMTVSEVDCQLLLFSGVNHSFTDPFAEASGVPGLKYDPVADGRAWRAMQALFDEAFQT